jgi:hypothetical protein
MPAATAVGTREKGAASAMVWIEDGASRIVRGEADSVTREGLHATLAEPPAFAQGDDVAVRIAFERGAPTLATTARVSALRVDAGGAEVRLVFTAPPNGRNPVEAWLSRAA